MRLGFPKMHYEKNEKRDFTPELFKNLHQYGVEIFLENGYGEKLGFSKQDYLDVDPSIKFCGYIDVLQKDFIIVIRTPRIEDLELMKKGAILFSMHHYPTHKKRNKIMWNLGIKPISMDSIADDFGQRYIKDFIGTAYNSMKLGFQTWVNMGNNDQQRSVNVTILGTGGIGRIAVDAAVHYGGCKLTQYPSIKVVALGRNSSENAQMVKDVFSETDILVDAILRDDSTKHIIPNEYIGFLKKNAIIVDMSADDYDPSIEPIQVKAIEGIPTGFLDKLVFYTNDEAYDKIPLQVSTKHKRTVVSCYSWPGVNPKKCLKRYEIQILPFLELVINNPNLQFNKNSNSPYERAIIKGLYKTSSKN